MMFSVLKFVIVIVLFGAICNECKSANVGDLSDNVQKALDLLTDGGLMQIGEVVASSPYIFMQVVSYWMMNWAESHCDWLNEELPNSVTNEWKYESSTNIITGPLVTWCDIEETFNPFALYNIENASVPEELYNEIAYLLSPEADGNQCLARLKFYVWDIFAIEWNTQFVANLGFESDMDLFMTIDEQLSGLLNYGDKLESNDDENMDDQCVLQEPAIMMEPFFEPLTQIYGQMFEQLEGTSITVSASFGVKLFYEYESEFMFGGGFGFAVNAQQEGFLYRESILNANQDAVVGADGSRSTRMQRPKYQSTYPPIESTQNNQEPSFYPSESHSSPQSTHNDEPEPSQSHNEPEPSQVHWMSSTRATQTTFESEPSMHPSQFSDSSEPHTTQPSETETTETTQKWESQSTETTHQTMTEPSIHPTDDSTQMHSTQSMHNTDSTKQTLSDPSIHPTIGFESTHPIASQAPVQSTMKSEPAPSSTMSDPTMHPSPSYYGYDPVQSPPSFHSTQVPPVQSTMNSEPEPSMFSTMKSSEPHSTQFEQHDPSMYSTVSYQKRRMQQGKPRGKQSGKQQATHQPVEPTMKSEPEPSFYPSESHPAQSEPSSPLSDPSIHPTVAMQYPTVSYGNHQPRMYATFYFELCLYDDIESIHSVELERELNDELVGIWITDPAVVYDGETAVGVCFNGEVSINGDDVEFHPGHPIGAVVLDKVATLVSGGKKANMVMMNRANIVSEKRVFEINEFVPMMIVFIAVGTIFVCAANLYSSYLGRKEYEPLLG